MSKRYKRPKGKLGRKKWKVPLSLNSLNRLCNRLNLPEGFWFEKVPVTPDRDSPPQVKQNPFKYKVYFPHKQPVHCLSLKDVEGIILEYKKVCELALLAEGKGLILQESHTGYKIRTSYLGPTLLDSASFEELRTYLKTAQTIEEEFFERDPLAV